MNLSRICAMSILLMAAGGAQAQEPLSARDFLNRVEGLTAWFTGAGGLAGIEHFHGDDTTTWIRADGSCSQGVITLRDEQVCFTYRDRPDDTYCWYPFVDGDDLSVVNADRPGSVQYITRTSRTRLSCEPDGAGV